MHSMAVFSLISGLLMSSEAIFSNPMSIFESAGSMAVRDARIPGSMLSAFCVGRPSSLHRWPGNLPGRMGTGYCNYHAPLFDSRKISMVPSKVVSRQGILIAMSSGEEEEGVSSTRGRKSGDPLGREKPMIFVGNLPWVLDSWGLEKLFEPFGKVCPLLCLDARFYWEKHQVSVTNPHSALVQTHVLLSVRPRWGLDVATYPFQHCNTSPQIVAAKISFDHETDRSRWDQRLTFSEVQGLRV